MNKPSESRDLLPVDVNNDKPENIMIIEGAEHVDLMNSLFTYIYVIILSLILGLFIHSSKEKHISNYDIIDKDASFSFSLTPLNQFYQYIYSDFQIKRIDTKNQLYNMSFDYNIKTYKSNHLIKNVSFSNFINIIFPEKNAFYSIPYQFYCEHSIDFDSVYFSINFYNLSHNFELISIRTANGRKSIILLNCLLRFFFMMLQALFLLVTYQKLKNESYWCREQKLTLLLAVSCFLYNNPLWMAISNYRFLDILFESLFYSFLKIYPILIFTILRESYITKIKYFRIAEVFLFILLFLTELHNHDILNISFSSISLSLASQIETNFRFEYVINVFYILCFIASMTITSSKLKGTDIAKNYFFCFSIVSSLIVYGISCALLKIRDSSKCSVNEFVKFVVSNTFVLLSSYFHWPHNTKNEIFYTTMEYGTVDLLDSENNCEQ